MDDKRIEIEKRTRTHDMLQDHFIHAGRVRTPKVKRFSQKFPGI